LNQRFKNNKLIYNSVNGVDFLQFENLKKYDNILKHCFSTRKGGVSTGVYQSLNLSLNRNDKRENVIENYKLLTGALGIDFENLVLSNQIHDNKVKVVEEKDRGKGIICDSDIIGYDGLVTNKRGVALVTFYADCVPIFFFDPKEKVAAVSHSGWKSTLKGIARETIQIIINEFSSKPEDIEVVVGPSIMKCCFEVGNEVYEEFSKKYENIDLFAYRISNEKWKLDLHGMIKYDILSEGILEDNILLSGVCTKCNNDIFFSHRGDNGKTGTLAAIMQIL